MEIALQSEQMFIANKPVDFRKSIDGLCALIVEEMQKDGQISVVFCKIKYKNRKVYIFKEKLVTMYDVKI